MSMNIVLVDRSVSLFSAFCSSEKAKMLGHKYMDEGWICVPSLDQENRAITYSTVFLI